MFGFLTKMLNVGEDDPLFRVFKGGYEYFMGNDENIDECISVAVKYFRAEKYLDKGAR